MGRYSACSLVLPAIVRIVMLNVTRVRRYRFASTSMASSRRYIGFQGTRLRQPPGIRMFVIRPLGFGEAPSDPESDAIWLEGNDSLVRRFRLELVPHEHACIVFVHGIRSNCGEAFSMLAASIKADERFRGWELMWCNYDWGYGVRLGASRLHDVLDFANSRAGEDGVYIVAHSMGGLVARAALLERSYPSVRRLIMLATPNFGAISTAQLSLFFQPVADVVFSLNGIYPKKRAYYDLTHTRELFQSERMARRKIENEYATVPAGYYMPTGRASM